MTAVLRLVGPSSDDAMSHLERFEIAMRGAGLSERTVTERINTLARLVAFAGKTLEHIIGIDVSRFLGRPDIMTATRNTYFGHIAAFYHWFALNGGHDATAGLKRPRKPRGVPHPVSTNDLHRLLAQRMRKRTRAMILLACVAGLRVHEIAKIRGDDIDPIARTLRVNGKGGLTVTLPLHPLLVETYFAMPRKGWWFPANSTRDGHVLARSVGTIIKGAMVRAGVPGSAHSLRHWFGTSLVQSGVDLRTTQTLLRHASLATTQIYIEVTDANRENAIDRLDPFGGERQE